MSKHQCMECIAGRPFLSIEQAIIYTYAMLTAQINPTDDCISRLSTLKGEMEPIKLEGRNEGFIIKGTSFNAVNLTRFFNKEIFEIIMEKNILDMRCGYTITVNFFYKKIIQAT